MVLKIFVFAIPAAGHLNPIIPILKELENQNVQIIVYSISKFKDLLEKQNFIYREYPNYECDKETRAGKDNHALLLPTLVDKLLDDFETNFVNVCRQIILERPDFILCDALALFGKMLIRFLNDNHNNPQLVSQILNIDIKESIKVPKSAVYCTSFATVENVYPNEEEKALSTPIVNSIDEYHGSELLKIVLSRAQRLSEKYSIKFKHPMKELFEHEQDQFLLALTWSELQIRAEMFNKNTNFVGACFSEEVRLNGFDKSSNDSVIQLLDSLDSSQKLIYISFGTVINDISLNCLIKLIEAFDESLLPDLKSGTIKVIVATGLKCYNELDELTKSGKLAINDNIMLAISVPQLTVLKRASLFITHCGMNSVHESIYHGVPMLCVPLFADQPLIANRVCSDLKLGLRLYSNSLTSKDAANAIQTILNDSSFAERCLQFSKLLKKYNGGQTGAKVILDYLNSQF